MGFSAGLSSMANGFFQGQEHIQDRDYLAKQRAYQDQIMQAGLSSLGDQTAADSAQAKLAAAQANSGTEVLPGQTANIIKSNQIKGAGLDFEAQQQPVTQAITARDNQFKTDSQPKAQAVAGAGLDSAVAQIPEQEKARVAGNASADSDRHMKSLVELSRLVSVNDKDGALAYLNKVSDAESVTSGTKGVKFVDIHATGDKPATPGDPDNRAFELVAEDGRKKSIPYASMQQALALSKTGKFSMRVGRDGATYVLNENTGAVQTPVQANPDLVRAANAGKTSEMQKQYEFLTQNESGPKLSKEKATDMITKGSHKTPEERYHAYKTELVKAAAAWNKPLDMQSITSQAAALAGFNPGAPGLSSNSPTPPTIDPKYQSLFTP